MEKLQNPRMGFLQQSKQRHLLSSPPSQVVSHGSLKDLQQQGFLGFHLSFQIFFFLNLKPLQKGIITLHKTPFYVIMLQYVVMDMLSMALCCHYVGIVEFLWNGFKWTKRDSWDLNFLLNIK